MTEITANLKMATETKGAIKYVEVDANGEFVSYKDGAIGTVYVRKSAFVADNWPKLVTVTVAERE